VWYLRRSGLLKPDQAVVFGRQGRGKPIIVEPAFSPRIEFNVSHDGGYVLLGINRGGQIGVDLMQLPIPEKAHEVEEALSEQLTLLERQNLSVPLHPSQKTRHLTTLWCVKECYTKAIGEGIGFGLERVSVDLAGDTEVQIRGGKVDGVGFDDMRWSVEGGWLADYRWVAIWQGGTEKVGVEVIEWDSFVEVFDSMHATS